MHKGSGSIINGRYLRRDVFEFEFDFELKLNLCVVNLGICDVRDLLERAQLSPLNDTEEGPAWKGLLEKVLRPEPTSKL